jgi:curli biogenesis system outer membrane secretion channel CsgG
MAMKLVTTALASVAALGIAACSTAPGGPVSAQSAVSPSPARSASPAPTVTKTIIKRPKTAATSPPAAPAPEAIPNVTDPWAVVSAYYGDVESGDYPQAWALLSSGMVTGQTYQQFVTGFACTGSQQLTEQGESGDQVTFSLAATDNCTGAVQNFNGTDTVVNGRIVSADVSQAS